MNESKPVSFKMNEQESELLATVQDKLLAKGIKLGYKNLFVYLLTKEDQLTQKS